MYHMKKQMKKKIIISKLKQILRTQQSVSHIHPTMTTPHNKNWNPFLQTTLQLTAFPMFLF